jgi:cell division protein FtsL
MPQIAARRLPLPPGAARRPIPRWVGPLAALVVVGVLATAFATAYWDGYRLRREGAELSRERERLRHENAQLREEIRLLNTPEYIERLAREQLGLVRPGEIAIMLVPPTPAATPRPGKRAPERSWWDRVMGR